MSSPSPQIERLAICDGSGVVETRSEYEPECCGNTTSSGECRGDCAVPREVEVEIPCPGCPACLGAYIARCSKHGPYPAGLHGARQTCFDCGGEVKQIPMVPLELLERSTQIVTEKDREIERLTKKLGEIGKGAADRLERAEAAESLAESRLGYLTECWANLGEKDNQIAALVGALEEHKKAITRAAQPLNVSAQRKADQQLWAALSQHKGEARG